MKKYPPCHPFLSKWLKKVGNPDAARQLGMTRQGVHKMSTGSPITGPVAIALETVSGGEIRRYDLRPDLFERK